MAIFFILITWCVLTLAFIGMGRTIWKAIGPKEAAGGSDWLVAFWLGYAATLCFLQFWNFWLPINFYALLIICAGGLLLLIPDAQNLLSFLRTQKRITLVAILLASVWVADRALGPGNADDSGFYHYTVIRWANEYPAVAGLANLSTVFTYNNASLLYAAMLNTGPWAGRGEHVTNGLLVIALFAQVLPALIRLARFTAVRPTDLFDLTLLTPAVMLTLAKDLPSPKTDLPAGVLTLVMAGIALRFFFEQPIRRPRTITILGILAGTLVALKLSTVVVAALLLGIPILYSLHTPNLRRTIIGAAIGGLLLVGPWVARNVILSGYPLYPSTVLPAPVSWRVPGALVDIDRRQINKQSKADMLYWLHDTLERNHLSTYARLAKPPFGKDESPQGMSWFRPWFFLLPISSLIEIVVPALVCLAAIIVLVRYRRPASAKIPGELVLCLAPVAALIFWLITAPDPRFGWPPAWVLAAMLTAAAYRRSGAIHNRRALNAAIFVSVFLVIPTLGYRLAVLHVQKQVSPLRQVPFQWPGPDHGLWPHPTTDFIAVTNRWGVKLNMPADRQSAMTWGGPLPCIGWNSTSNDANVRQRRPGDISAGFATDGRPTRAP